MSEHATVAGEADTTTLRAQAFAATPPRPWRLHRYEVPVLLAIAAAACVWFGAVVVLAVQ